MIINLKNMKIHRHYQTFTNMKKYEKKPDKPVVYMFVMAQYFFCLKSRNKR